MMMHTGAARVSQATFFPLRDCMHARQEPSKRLATVHVQLLLLRERTCRHPLRKIT